MTVQSQKLNAMSARLVYVLAVAGCAGSTQAMSLALSRAGSNLYALRTMQRAGTETRNFGLALTGAGVNLGQVEPNRPGFAATAGESNHPDVVPAGVALSIGAIVSPPAANAGIDNHATQVAGVMNGQGLGIAGPPAQAGEFGVAPSARLFSVGYSNGVTADEQNRAIRGAEWVRGRGARFINHSYGEPPSNASHSTGAAVLDGNNLLSRYVDFSATQHGQVQVIAGNEDLFNNRNIPIPTDAFNKLVVGATGRRSGAAGARFDEVANFNTTNNSADGRIGTDIVAPGGSSLRVTIETNAGVFVGNVDSFPFTIPAGQRIRAGSAVRTDANSDPRMPVIDANNNGVFGDLGYQRSGGTSFAAPQVTAALGLMQEHATANNITSFDGLTARASVMNSASKHVLSKRVDTNADSQVDQRGQSWPQRYFAGSTTAGGEFRVTQPKDADIGIGQLNGVSAIQQINTNNTGNVSIHSGAVPALGRAVFPIDGKLTKGSLVTSTLTWDRIVTNTAGGASPLETVGNYNVRNLGDLDLRVRNKRTGAFVASSRSSRDNVEHIYFNVRDEDEYEIVVDSFSGNAESFGLAKASGASKGMSFTVETGAQGRLGNVGNPWPNDVNALGPAGHSDYTTGGEIFSTALNGTNQHRLSGGLGTVSRVGPHIATPAAEALLAETGAQVRGVLGIQPGDQLASLTFGRDGSRDMGGNAHRSIFGFSVDRDSFGLAGSAVDAQVLAPGGRQQAGDIYRSRDFDPFGTHATTPADAAPAFSNTLMHDQSALGLYAPGAPGRAITTNTQDNLRDFDFDNILTNVDSDGDGLNNRAVFFTLSRTSPTVSDLAGMLSPADILVSTGSDPSANFDITGPASFNFSFFARAENIGLPIEYGIDALILNDVGRIGVLDPGMDTAIFSLDRDSGTAHAANLYFTNFTGNWNPNSFFNVGGSLFAQFSELGLSVNANIDGLDILRIPAPGAALVLTLLGLGAARRRRTS